MCGGVQTTVNKRSARPCLQLLSPPHPLRTVTMEVAYLHAVTSRVQTREEGLAHIALRSGEANAPQRAHRDRIKTQPLSFSFSPKSELAVDMMARPRPRQRGMHWLV